jgi:hypothetical protein
VPRPRTAMRKIREVLRLSGAEHLSTRSIAASTRLPRRTARPYLERANEIGLSWPLPADLDDPRPRRASLWPAILRASAQEYDPRERSGRPGTASQGCAGAPKMGRTRPVAVDVPTMWAHRISNAGSEDFRSAFWSNEVFDPSDPDTFPEEV